MKIGGEYGGVLRGRARCLFLLAIESKAPEVIKALKELLPLYSEPNWHDVIDQEYASQDEYYEHRDINKRAENLTCSAWKSLCRDTTLIELKKALQEWGNHFNIAEAWVFEAALLSLYKMNSVPKDLVDKHCISWNIIDPDDSEIILHGDVGIFLESEKRLAHLLAVDETVMNFLFSFEGWNPFAYARSRYKEQITECFKESLEEYLDQIESCIPQNFSRTPDIRNIERFEWLARYQVCGESFNKIAESEFTSRQAVSDRIKEAAEMCGITLRPPSKPGRPPKK